MSVFTKRGSKKAGLPPGTLIHIGEKKTEKARIQLMNYDSDRFEEREIEAVEDCFPYKDTPGTTWINVDGIHDVDLVQKIGTHFQIHPLVQEDVLNTAQRPKLEEFEEYIFVALKMLTYGDGEGLLTTEHISLILGPNYVISFQEVEGDVFNPLRERIRAGKGRIRKAGADYLAYALMDAVVDNYFIALEGLGEELERLEEGLMEDTQPVTLERIHHLRRALIFQRRAVWPLREAIGTLERSESSLIQERTTIYLRDVYDHTVQVIDTVETLRDMASGMLEVYLTSVSNRMNEVMKVLTIIATIFIPLTFIAGVYGMNFKNMPELDWPWGYPLVLGVMLGLGAAMVLWFRHRKWL
jgi:magnesium transporter